MANPKIKKIELDKHFLSTYARVALSEWKPLVNMIDLHSKTIKELTAEQHAQQQTTQVRREPTITPTRTNKPEPTPEPALEYEPEEKLDFSDTDFNEPDEFNLEPEAELGSEADFSDISPDETSLESETEPSIETTAEAEPDFSDINFNDIDEADLDPETAPKAETESEFGPDFSDTDINENNEENLKQETKTEEQDGPDFSDINFNDIDNTDLEAEAEVEPDFSNVDFTENDQANLEPESKTEFEPDFSDLDFTENDETSLESQAETEPTLEAKTDFEPDFSDLDFGEGNNTDLEPEDKPATESEVEPEPEIDFLNTEFNETDEFNIEPEATAITTSPSDEEPSYDTPSKEDTALPFLLTQTQIKTVLAGPYQNILKILLSAYAKTSRLRYEKHVTKEDVYKGKRAQLPEDLIISASIIEKTSFSTLNDIQNQLDESTDNFHQAWQAFYAKWATQLTASLKQQNIQLTEYETKELHDEEPMPELLSKFVELNLTRPKLGDIISFTQYLSLKVHLPIQSALSRQHLPHTDNDISKIIKNLKSDFNSMGKEEKQLLNQQQKHVTTVLSE